jgi:hypothetical protein
LLALQDDRGRLLEGAALSMLSLLALIIAPAVVFIN